jgi:hypothetical protein
MMNLAMGIMAAGLVALSLECSGAALLFFGISALVIKLSVGT